MLVVIPARGGSKRLTGKNIRPLCGKPLLVFAVEVARNSGFVDEIIVSTEDAKIAAIARDTGATVVDRPVELASDSASTESVLLHALDALQSEGLTFDWVMTLPPSSPLRCPQTVADFVETMRADPDAQDCLMSVHENRGDFWTQKTDGTLRRLFPDAPRRQQDRAPLLEENSAIYLTRVAALRATGSILGSRVRGIPIDPIEAIDIHTDRDLVAAEAYLRSWGGEVPQSPPGRITT